MKISAFIYWLIVDVCMERFSLKICSCRGNNKQRFYDTLGLVTMVTGEILCFIFKFSSKNRSQ